MLCYSRSPLSIIIINNLHRRISKISNKGRFLSSSSTQVPNHSEQNMPTFDYNSRLNCTFPKGDPLEIHTVWLRHHCRCDKCYNYKTHQRVKIPSDLPRTSSVTNTSVRDNHLVVTWNDGHVSKYQKEWLINNMPRPTKQSRKSLQMNRNITDASDVTFGQLRNKSQLRNPLETSIPYEDFMKMKSDEGVSQLLRNILEHGFGIVSECPPDFETTKKVVTKVSHPQNTIYGDFYEWTSDLAHADTAYTSDVVHLHTDTSYFTEPIGLQIFHCLKHDGTGGINWLADGFQVARQISKNNPQFYNKLSNEYVPCQYIDLGKHHFRSNDVTFGHDWTSGQFQKIRYNPHDMAVLKDLSMERVPEFYESLVHLSDMVEKDPMLIKLTPGLVIFLDNWRILHGRSAFTGFRHLCGTYISRSDWLSRARTLKLIN